jgi:hypothetical protein
MYDDLQYAITAGAVEQQPPVTIQQVYCDGELVDDQVIPFFPTGEPAYYSNCDQEQVQEQSESVEESFIKVHVFSSSVGWQTLDIGEYDGFNGWLSLLENPALGVQQHYLAIDVFGNASAIQADINDSTPVVARNAAYYSIDEVTSYHGWLGIP